ncbi:50S ribosome-binding GTPase [Salinibacterium sp. NG253]|uniref:GTPase family protein n=1 Tax=Salinibacterium sp. NG253 TaxID=2792039 RepID=UPI0018CFD460|nr:GTPase [Salinibacterium sp. NG253]MBH0117995.1 50S ribosome-binding GTPase [Salinibacterium sp. NG253]
MSAAKPSLDERIAALRTVTEAGVGRIPSELMDDARALLHQAEARRSRSSEHTVVGVFGATGSGKSSLVNALVGAEVAVAHVRRPTTSQPLAVLWDAAGSAALLDWLEIRERVERPTPIDPRASKLVLVDLPDVDSVEAGNRAVAERLASQVDALIWVVDPQKYADDVLHAQFIAPHARHAAVTLVVLNQIDLLSADDRAAVVKSLQAIVERDGLPRARVLPVSARTGEGVDALRKAIGDLAATKAVRDARLSADVQTLAARIEDPGTPQKVTAKSTARLRDEVGTAAGVDIVASAVARSYRKRSGQATGWPLVSWIGRLRADPLTRLGLGPKRRGDDPDVHRTSMPLLSAGAQARMSMAVRAFTDETVASVSPPWRAAARATAEQTLDALPSTLDLAIARTPLPAKGSWWWVLVGIVQWIAVVIGLGGALWLVGAALLPTFGLPAFPLPAVEEGPLTGWAIPTLLLIAAVLLGILLGLISAVLSALTAGGRRRRARRRLLAAVDEVVQRDVVAPVVAALEQARAVSAALQIARR